MPLETCGNLTVEVNEISWKIVFPMVTMLLVIYHAIKHLKNKLLHVAIKLISIIFQHTITNIHSMKWVRTEMVDRHSEGINHG